jgi:hypothetical protein
VQALEVVARAIAENADCVHDDVDAFQKRHQRCFVSCMREIRANKAAELPAARVQCVRRRMARGTNDE